MFFRPEEIDVTSEKGVRNLCPLADGDAYMTDHCLWSRMQQLAVLHTNREYLTTVKTTGLKVNFFAWKEPAHGQRFQSSLRIPLLLTVYRDQILGRDIRKGCP